MAKKTARKAAKKTTRKTGARKGASKGARKSARKSARKGARKGAGRGRTNAAFMAPVQPNDKLAPVVGSNPIPRTEVTKRLWAYIRKNNLQDTTNRRMINADDTLKAVFGGKSSVNMFEMTKLVNKNVK
jgi:chromatin remodeling complex protein RSC6